MTIPSDIDAVAAFLEACDAIDYLEGRDPPRYPLPATTGEALFGIYGVYLQEADHASLTPAALWWIPPPANM